MSKGQPLPYPLDECAGCRDLTQQLAQAQMELRERAKDCAEHCEDFTRAQLQLNTVKRQLAQMTQERDKRKDKP